MFDIYGVYALEEKYWMLQVVWSLNIDSWTWRKYLNKFFAELFF